jgi:hypothetical protein
MDRARQVARKRQVAGRIQQIINDTGLSPTAFYRTLAKSEKPRLKSVIRGWLPPPSKWSWDAEKQKWIPKPHDKGRIASRESQDADWDAVKSPRSDLLLEFCQHRGNASADFVLFGEGNAYRGETRPKADLATDLEAYVSRTVAARAKNKKWGGPNVTAALYRRGAAELLDEVVINECAKHKKEWKRIYKPLYVDELPPQKELGKLVKRYGNIAIVDRSVARDPIVSAAAQSANKRSTHHGKTPSNKAN